MKKNWRKAAMAGFICAAMAIAGPAAVRGAEVPENGQVLVDIPFDDGGTGGFVVYTNGGSCEISNADSALAVDITDCGKLDYANQVYWDGFSLVKDCEYTYSFDISCDIERPVEYRLQLNGGDYHAYLGEWIPVGPDLTHVSVDWVMWDETDPAPRIAFNMGRTPEMNEDPGPHRILIDNVRLEVKDASGASVEAQEEEVILAVDQVGYRPEDEKIFYVPDSAAGDTFAVIRDASGGIVAEGMLGESVYDEASDQYLRRGDFSSLTQTGIFHIEIENETESIVSAPFRVNEDVYGDLFEAAVKMLTMQRCGTALSQETAGEWAHDECHTNKALICGTDEKKDVTGGWHDAGDYGRYVVPGAKTAADLFLAAEFSGDDDLSLLDEALWELDWMLKMQDDEGGVYHKVTCRNFPGSVMPEEETDELVLCPVSAAATADFAAVMAKASRVYKDSDPDFAAKALTAAKKAWSWLEAQDELKGFHNPDDIATGEYPDEDLSDECFWAAAELFLAGETQLENTVKTGVEEFSSKVGPAPELGWDHMTTYALADLAREDAPEDLRLQCASLITEQADTLLDQCEAEVYKTGLGTDFPWGSNMSVANNAVSLMLASNLTGEDKYEKTAQQMLHYLLGSNGLGMSYVTGFGSVYPLSPHHRPSQADGSAVPGMLVGGPNSHLEDPYAQGVLSQKAPALCYADNDASYSTNEVAIYWNSPLIALLSALK